jgi:Heterokaryon incompatibility protein (HET)
LALTQITFLSFLCANHYLIWNFNCYSRLIQAYYSLIICSLEILSLDSSYNYESLSYVWGDPIDTIPIHANGCRFNAARNLYWVRRLRTSSAPRRVWVDAICINQDDVDERGAQVSIMREIYCKASVLVYLGVSLATEAITLEEQEKCQATPQDVWHKDDTQITNLIRGGWARIVSHHLNLFVGQIRLSRLGPTVRFNRSEPGSRILPPG